MRKLIVLSMTLIILGVQSAPIQAQESPEELGIMLIEAINADDEEAFINLMHPELKEYFQKNDQDKLNKKVQRMLKNQITDDYKVNIEPLSENEYWKNNYDLGLKQFDMGFQIAQFLVNPSHLINIQYTKEDGNNKSYSDPIVEHNEKWYFLWPIEEKMK